MNMAHLSMSIPLSWLYILIVPSSPVLFFGFCIYNGNDSLLESKSSQLLRNRLIHLYRIQAVVRISSRIPWICISSISSTGSSGSFHVSRLLLVSLSNYTISRFIFHSSGKFRVFSQFFVFLHTAAYLI